MKTESFGFGISGLDYMKKNKEYPFINGSAWILQTITSCLQ